MKKISLLPILALVLGIATSAFTSPSSSMERWHLIAGKTINDAKDPLAYEPDNGSFSCNNVQNLPCIVEFDPAVYPSLQDYLDSFTSETQVRDAAVGTRSN